jgi:hypothetical protein
MIMQRLASQRAPNFALDGAKHFSERLLGVHEDNACIDKYQQAEPFGALPDHVG